MNPKIVFFGSPAYAKTILGTLHRKFPVTAVVSQPDKPSGRGRVLSKSPVKEYAIKNQIVLYEPKTLRDNQIAQILKEINPDIFIVAAYGKILPKNILDIPKNGCLNIHASLLPRWRGASPIQSAIIHGDNETGVTLMVMDEGIDTGPIIANRKITIEKKDTGSSLTDKLAFEGSNLITDCLVSYLEGRIKPEVQDESRSTFCKIIKKEDGLINFDESAENIERKIRAFNPWPVCYIPWKGNSLRIFEAKVSETKSQNPGQKAVLSQYPAIGTSTSYLLLTDIQPSGKKRMSGNAFLNGNRDWLDF